MADGKARGFEWTRRDLTPSEREELVGIAREITERLNTDLTRDGLSAAVADEAFFILCDQYVDQARDEVQRRQAFVDELIGNRMSRD